MSLHGILRGTVERFDSQVLFNQFEEKFYLPSITIEICDRLFWNDEVIGQEVERFDCFAVLLFDSSQQLRLTFTAAGPGQEDRLVAS